MNSGGKHKSPKADGFLAAQLKLGDIRSGGWLVSTPPSAAAVVE